MTDPLLAAMRAGQPLTGVDVIDVHASIAHLGPYSPVLRSRLRRQRDGRRYAPYGRTRGGPVVASCDPVRRAQRQLRDVAGRRPVFPDRIAGYAVVNPWQRPERELRRLAGEPRFVGVKVHPDLHEYPLTGAAYEPLWGNTPPTVDCRS
ncbi:amidohydrolase family protein [Fodinicola feengrottensis]|uniref:amidohydrolase family protein n=1 Tax=Fodinicola feengrottensis TaxID=435914 RepID=UPI0013D15ACB|nr:amidohydrolase family protein [Fodinicola feengrottensis]